MTKLSPSEYAPYYAGYVARFADKDIMHSLAQQMDEVKALFSSISEDQKDYRYESSKWTIGELILHISDAERVFAYRALCFARGEQKSIPGFEQDDYVANCKADQRTLKSLLEEFYSIRNATISLFDSFDEDTLLLIGKANEQAVSVRALAYILLGHCQHHMEILKERYFV